MPRKKVLSNCFMHRTSQAFDKYDPADCLVRMLRWYTAQEATWLSVSQYDAMNVRLGA